MKLDKINSNQARASKIAAPLEINPEELLGNIEDLDEWSDLSGDRKTWALIPFGRTGFAEPERSKELYNKRPKLKSFFKQFPGNVIHAVYSYLAPGKIIEIHQDTFKSNGDKRPKFPIFNSTFRFHIPLITNDLAYYYSERYFYRMQKGELWTINNHLPHGVINNDRVIGRYHLIFDVEPNEETYELYKQSNSSLGFMDGDLQKLFHKA
jgi:hypothetical protein